MKFILIFCVFICTPSIIFFIIIIESLIKLNSERFYEHINDTYGNLVLKILQYHDIDSYEILNQVSLKELIDLFEKADDENSTPVLINLKKEICNISEDTFSLKVGTKTKLISLLKSTHDMMKWKRLQLRVEKIVSQQRSIRPSTSNDEIMNPIMNDNAQKQEKLIRESIDKILVKINRKVHGIEFSEISKENFKILLEHGNDLLSSACSIQCICGDRIKLFKKNQHFQLSNLSKHLTLIKIFETPFLSRENEEPSQTPTQSSRNRSNNNGPLNNTAQNDSSDNDSSLSKQHP